MATLNFEGYRPVPGGRVLTAFTVSGTTETEILAKAMMRAAEIGLEGETIRCVGLHNNRADWEDIFGPSGPGLHYGDDPVERSEPSPRAGFWRRVLSTLLRHPAGKPQK